MAVHNDHEAGWKLALAASTPHGQGGRRCHLIIVVVAVVEGEVVHHISWATARAGPSKHVGRVIGRVDRVLD